MSSSPSFRATVAALAFGQIMCWAALFYTFSSLVLPMQRALGWSRPELMGAFTLGLGLWGGATFAVGAAIDRGRGRVVLTAGTILAGLGFIGWSRVESLPALYAAWSVMGVAMAMTLYEPAFNVLTRRFPERFRQGIMALTLVGGFASTLAFPAVAWLIAQLEWRGALAAIGIFLLVVVAPVHAWALRGAGQAASVGGRHPDALADATLREALREPAFWYLTVAFALNAFAVAGLFAHLMPAFAEKGVSEAESIVVVVCFGPAQVFARFVCASVLSGRIPRRIAIAVMAGLPLALAIFAFGSHLVALIAFSVLFGLSNGLVTIVRGSLVPDYFGRGHVGRISGAMSTIALLGRAAAPFLIAWLLVPLGDYRRVLIVLTLLGIGSALAYAMAGKPRPERPLSRSLAVGDPA